MTNSPIISSPSSSELGAFYRVMEGTADATGEVFIRELTRQITLALNVKYAFVSIFTSDNTKLRMLSFFDGEQFQNIGEYDLAPTPCSKIIEGKAYICAKDLPKSFPNDPHLKSIGAESFRGVPMITSDGTHFGYIGAVDTKPIVDEPDFISVLSVFAKRAAAELKRVTMIAPAAEIDKQFRAVVESVPDAILNVDTSRTIRLFNRSAERLFNIKADQIIGSTVDQLVTPMLLQELQRCLKGHFNSGVNASYMWLRSGLMALRTNGEPFEVEGTVSFVSIDSVTHCTLSIREVRTTTPPQESQSSNHQEGARTDGVSATTHVIGQSIAMQEVIRQARQVADTSASVLILGESGTGKELLADAIYRWSSRCDSPFIRVNCAALPATLIESELFGHEKGSFTGADVQRIGLFERANTGTIFLDEIGELPLELQPKLLRVLQEREFERIGGSKTIRIDVRIIAATNQDLELRLAEGNFREDLYYRLSVFPISMPPLRDRREDIIELAEYFVSRLADTLGKRTSPILSSSARRTLMDHVWPGNIRELANVIERAIILHENGELEVNTSISIGSTSKNVTFSLQTLQEREKIHIVETLKQTKGVIHGSDGAAIILGINESTLRSRMKKLGVGKMDYKNISE